MKPNGIMLDADGRLKVRPISKAEDAIWDAVETAINEGWDARKFRSEVADAWDERLKEDAKDARKILTGA